MGKALEIAEYVDENGKSPFGTWFATIDPRAGARVSRVIARMEQGNVGGLKSVGGGVMENRIDFGPGYRLYIGRDGDTLIVLLAGGTKRRQADDIRAAQIRWSDYKRRKGAARRGGIDPEL